MTDEKIARINALAKKSKMRLRSRMGRSRKL